MRLTIFLPTEMFMDQEVLKVTGESVSGGFCLLPRHIDYVTALAPGILSYETHQGQEKFLAVNRGILVKQGEVVSVATRFARAGVLGELEDEVRKMILQEDEKEKMARSAAAGMEANFVRGMLEFGKSG
ncbi:MAG: F0F1 ATP synthase subunit epsilon [Thermodesulfobacteriota bacterium]|nr:F0F1 ATP synthase subunit epsilon [Thermodesulfobacteriota bacterium]